jgi:dTDP-4-dehydrorhamnose 3,5-epimerase
MKVSKAKLDGVLIIEPPTRFEDFRGEYIEIYNEELYKKAGVAYDFVQDDISISSRHVLRGIHGDGHTAKLVSCLAGKFYLVVVNWDATSPQYRQWEAFTLSDRNRLQVLIPPKFGNGHLVLSETAIFHYKQNSQYDRSSQFTLIWNDPTLGIWWPHKEPFVSQRDETPSRA